jgi:hypothetical protein
MNFTIRCAGCSGCSARRVLKPMLQGEEAAEEVIHRLKRVGIKGRDRSRWSRFFRG